jgi:hypothetical protein
LIHGSYCPEYKLEQFCAETITCDERTNSSACNTDLLYRAVGRYTQKQPDFLIKVLRDYVLDIGTGQSVQLLAVEQMICVRFLTGIFPFVSKPRPALGPDLPPFKRVPALVCTKIEQPESEARLHTDYFDRFYFVVSFTSSMQTRG